MAYYLDLFSSETYETFTKSNRDISGFRARQENAASRVKVGDISNENSKDIGFLNRK